VGLALTLLVLPLLSAADLSVDPFGETEAGDSVRPSTRADAGPREFYFARLAYGQNGFRRRPTWAIDFPEADEHFVTVVERLTNLDIHDRPHPLRLDDPDLRRFPFLYALEVGGMGLSDHEVAQLREYLLAGGFLVVDDFWGTWEWRNFESQITRVLPEFPVVELPLEHPLFTTFYDIKEVKQVPSIGNALRGGPTWEQDGYEPQVRGIFDDTGRLMVVINWNTDLGDAWEWADSPYYPLEYSTYAFQVAVNTIVYAMSH
jgi:hypothetical protein